jgi:hypothetical protein
LPIALAAVLYWCAAIYLILMATMIERCAPVATADGLSIDACLQHKQLIVIVGFVLALLIYSVALWRIARRGMAA